MRVFSDVPRMQVLVYQPMKFEAGIKRFREILSSSDLNEKGSPFVFNQNPK